MTDPSPPFADLAADPRHRAHLAARETARRVAESQFYADPSVLYADLRTFGAPTTALDTYFDGVPLSGRAMAVLVAHLPRPYAPEVWERIVRSLTRHDARPALPMLCWAYRIERLPARRWLLANALGAMATFREVADLPGIDAYEALFRPSMTPPHRRRAL